ncbi:hypothetical protein M0Q97_02730 [Candidatus Dojkabacteria bacterium]|jgi:hypothetical protein|nr:hypothetical protein [Candidatus Dojkabacteria bacterium]
MTTREIYFKILILRDLPIGIARYSYKNKDGDIYIDYINLELRTDKIIVEKYVNIMKEIEKTNGFMFWNNSPKSEEFFKNNLD